MVNPIPEGFHSVCAQITIADPAAALDFYAAAFGAEEVLRIATPDGSMVMHAEMRIGDSMVMLACANPDMGCHGPSTENPSTVTVHIYTPDVDAAYERAVAAGATPLMPLTDMFWGDRYALLMDPWGQRWSMATHTEDLSPEEIGQRAAAMFGGNGCGGEG